LSVRRLRIALISTPFIAVPPVSYGGTELIVAELARALHAAGHEVVVYATGDSALPGIEIRSYFPTASWPPSPETDQTHAAWALRDVLRDGQFDLVHSHSQAVVALSKLCTLPIVHTLHHDRDEELSRMYALTPHVSRVAISYNQATREPASAHHVVHHGLDPSRFLRQPDDGYLLFIGRYSRVKAPHLAIDVATRAGLPIVMAGRSHDEPGDEDYFERELAPRLALPHVLDVGPVGGLAKQKLLAGARAVVFPIQWEEPFGLVMIESMLSGVPVIALRRGSVPEVIDEGTTGFICDSTEDMVRAAAAAHLLDRAAVHARAVRRFSAARMARSYLTVYQQVLGDQAVTATEPAEEKLGA